MSNSQWAPEDSAAASVRGPGVLIIVCGPAGPDLARCAEALRGLIARRVGGDVPPVLAVQWNSATSAEVARARAAHEVVIITHADEPTPNPLGMIEQAAAWREVCEALRETKAYAETEISGPDTGKAHALRAIERLVERAKWSAFTDPSLGVPWVELQPGCRSYAIPFMRAEEAIAIWHDLRKQSADFFVPITGPDALSPYERYLYESACLYLADGMQCGNGALERALAGALSAPADAPVELKSGIVLSAGQAAQWRETAAKLAAAELRIATLEKVIASKSRRIEQARQEIIDLHAKYAGGAERLEGEIDKLRRDLEAAHEDLSEEVSGRQDPAAAPGVGFLRCSPSLPGYVRSLEVAVDDKTAELARACVRIDELAREVSRLLDRVDLQRDEFQRIRSCPGADDEIRGLCDRAVKEIEQRVPVLVQRDEAEKVARRLEARVLELEAELAGSKRQLDVMQIFPANGIGAFARERCRQVAVEGYSAEHDDKHVDGEIALAAAAYAVPEDDKGRRIAVLSDLWPWDWAHWKPSPEDRLREIEKAGALLAAEWDRLDRLRVRAGKTKPKCFGSSPGPQEQAENDCARCEVGRACAEASTLATEAASGEPGASGGPTP